MLAKFGIARVPFPDFEYRMSIPKAMESEMNLYVHLNISGPTMFESVIMKSTERLTFEYEEKNRQTFMGELILIGRATATTYTLKD